MYWPTPLIIWVAVLAVALIAMAAVGYLMG